MGIYFGTDGIRGEYGEELSSNLVHKCGNSLARFCPGKKVLIGRDTRLSGSLLTLSFASGLTAGGVDVIDGGILPTPVIAFLGKKLHCDFSVVISASHNPARFNGVKIYDNQGYKISEQIEGAIERKLFSPLLLPFDKVGKYVFEPNLINLYKSEVRKYCSSLDGLKIVLDCAHGASSVVAKQIFSALEAKVITLCCDTDGEKINENCGALFPDEMIKEVLKRKADMGFSFDGDADRIVACDEKGNILDGDDILFILASHLGSCKAVVGTTMTNKGLERALAKKKISLLRADVGDKYVVEMMKNKGAMLGGEPSGHIVIRSISTTGDGVLCALVLAQISKKLNKPLSSISRYKKFPQVNLNIPVIDKYRILNSEKLSSEILSISKSFADEGRVLVRASGTENKIRIMCEHSSKKIAQEKATILEEIVLNINNSQKIKHFEMENSFENM